MLAALINKITLSAGLALFITSMSEVVSKEKKKICNYSGVTCSRTLVIAAPFIGFCAIFGQLGKLKFFFTIFYQLVLNKISVPQMIMSGINIFASIMIIICIQTPRTIEKCEKPKIPRIFVISPKNHE